MFRFRSPEYLYLLVILPLLAFIFFHYMRSRKKKLQSFGSIELLKKFLSDLSIKKYYIKFWIIFICTILFILIIAEPQFSFKLKTEKKYGIEILVCLDVSNSMLSTDIIPTRLDKAKQILACLIDKLENNKIGLIVFAGNAFIQLPITSDYISAKIFLSSIHPSMISTQGTSIAQAINLAIKSFTPSENIKKTIILITDGEDHENYSIAAAKKAIKKGINIDILGIGTIHGSPIPIHNGYLKDKNGNLVLSKLNENLCKKITDIGNGIYIRVENTNNTLKILQKELNKKEKSYLKSKIYSYDEKYEVLAWPLLFLLIIEIFISKKLIKL